MKIAIYGTGLRAKDVVINLKNKKSWDEVVCFIAPPPVL